jgi:hypothetical protein
LKRRAIGPRFQSRSAAGRANFITGELPIRTGLTTVGQAGADVGIPAEAATLATALKPAVRMDDVKFTFYAQPYGWPGKKSRPICPS